MNQELETLINNLINAGGVYAWSKEAYNAHDALADYYEANYTDEVFLAIKSKIPGFTY